MGANINGSMNMAINSKCARSIDMSSPAGSNTSNASKSKQTLRFFEFVMTFILHDIMRCCLWKQIRRICQYM